MNQIQQFKEQHSLIDLARQFGYTLYQGGGQHCPLCHRKTFSIYRNNTRYKCFHPDCILNKGGDIFNFMETCGISHSFSESLKLLGLKAECKQTTNNRAELLYRVLCLYQEELTQPNCPALEYIQSRGYSLELLRELEVGYAPKDGAYLLNRLRQSAEELKKELLITPSGKDYIVNRLVFPIYNSRQLVHLHCRSIDPSVELRWLATKNPEDVPPNTQFIWNPHKATNCTTLFLTEGISDGLSLYKLGLPVNSVLSIYSDIEQLLRPQSQLTELICLFDNDTYAYGRIKSEQYKSWEVILPKLLSLKEKRKEVRVWCVVPPLRPGIKDVNDWINSEKDVSNVISYIEKQAQLLDYFAYDYFINQPSKHKLILPLLKTNPKLRSLFIEWVEAHYHCWLDYLEQQL